MQWKRRNSAFTVLEFLIASALTVSVGIFSVVGINAILDYKKNENGKPRLILEACTVLDGIEKDRDNKCLSLGNLLCREQVYPLQYSPARGPVAGCPALMFFVNSEEGPKLICYSLGPLPSVISGGDSSAMAPCGLFKLTKDADSSATIWRNFETVADLSAEFNSRDLAKLANLVSECIVLLEVHLVKFNDDGFSLNYLNSDAQEIKINAEKSQIGVTSITLKDLAFVEITVGALLKSQHREYFSLANDLRKEFLEKNGIRLSRLLPWRI